MERCGSFASLRKGLLGVFLLCLGLILGSSEPILAQGLRLGSQGAAPGAGPGSGPGGGPRIFLTLSNGSRSIALPALDQAYVDFIGGGAAATATAGGRATAGASVLVDPDIFNFDAVNYKLRSAFELRLSLEQDWQFSPRGFVYGRGAVFAGQRRYDLPQGAGILIDPINVRFASFGAEVSGGVAQRVAMDALGLPLSVQTEFGLGVQQVRVHTSVQSALLDVRSLSNLTRPFVEFGLSVAGRKAASRQRGRWHSTARLRVQRDRTFDVLFGMQFGL